MHLISGTLLKRGEYRIIDSLGRGGFGVTYLAEQVNLHRKVCIKEFLTLLDSDEPVVTVLTDESEKTKIVTPQPKTPIEPAPKPKRSRWWVWLLGLLLIGGCGAWFIFGDNNTEDVALPETSTTYNVGDYYNVNGKQGVVFEVTADGRHGKIVSLDEATLAWDSRVEWKDGSGYINGTKTGANSLSDGKANTDKVMSRPDSRYFKAFVWCRNKGADWYLPAKEELEAIFNNKSAISSTLAKYGAKLVIYGNYYHLSSTESEDYKPKFCAWGVGVNLGSNGNLCKGYRRNVRAVSAF